MPVMWRDLAGWNAAKLAGIADALIKDRNTLVGMQEHVESAAAPKGFVGKHADAAAEQLRRYAQHLEVRVAQQAAVATAFDRAVDAVEVLLRKKADVEALVATNPDVAIARDDGQVMFVGDDDEIVPGSERDEAAARVKAEAQDQVDEVMRLANEVDINLSNTMHWAAIGWIDDDGATNLEDAAEAGEDEALDIAHHNLLSKYQVATDPDGMTLWPSGLTGWLWEQMGNKRNEVTATEARMLDDLQMRQGLLGIKELNDIRQDALHRGETIFDGKGQTDGHSDAFRHAYWNARMTQRFGPEWTAEFATAHERNPSSHPTPVAMDLHNNEVGRRIAMDNPDASPDELAQLIEQAVNNGELKVIDEYDKVVPSDRVDKGETRSTEPGNEWPTDNPERKGHNDPGQPSSYPEDRY